MRKPSVARGLSEQQFDAAAAKRIVIITIPTMISLISLPQRNPGVP